ncbi:MAG: N-acetylmuramoyl-L-alanine amidase [Eubacteriales bacterium]|nr:N-acetylmuramoyl-L-alanine amidase [Eubacteriales bacterium]MDY3333023.1 N-acetylmuramoyl-L-alanine amidase [Gallibacter sp.]
MKKHRLYIYMAIFSLFLILYSSNVLAYNDNTKENNYKWEVINGSWHYTANDGSSKIGWIKWNKKWYYLNAEGIMQTGIININGTGYYLDKSGAMQVNWQYIDGKWYYFNSNGDMHKGWIKWHYKWYYLNVEGVMQTGWIDYNGNSYFLAKSGAMLTHQWIKDGGKFYYIRPDGSKDISTERDTIDGLAFINKNEYTYLNLNVKETILEKNPCYKEKKQIIVKGLMLHSVGCPISRADTFTKSWNNPNYDRACVHAFIDSNTGEVHQHLPWNHRGWHAGGLANNTHIGVEMCESETLRYISGSRFTSSNYEKARKQAKTAYNSAVKLFALLCKKHDLNPLGKGVIISHTEGHLAEVATNHGDPEHYWKQLNLGYTMNTFRNDVNNLLKIIER